MPARSPEGKVRVLQGRRGEDLAVAWLVAKGWEILERNFRTRGGEVDIIARKGLILDFIEVKHWCSSARTDIWRVAHPSKRDRMAKAAGRWLGSRNPEGWNECRMDLLVVPAGRGEIEWYPGALEW